MNGRNIVKFREDNGFSQVELAEKLNVASSTLSRWENNKSAPRGKDYDKLISIIGEEYNTDVDLTTETTTKQVVEAMSDRVNDILYQVTTIKSSQQERDNEDRRSKRIHRIIRTVLIGVTCALILLLAAGTWFYIMNYGFRGEVKEGPVKIGKPSYYTIDDLSELNTDN